MKLKQISLQNFRNYSDLEIELNDNINIFYGNNAVGKTNILEGIYTLALTKSHRTQRTEELINNDEEFLRVKGKVHIEKTNRNKKIEIFLNKLEKKVYINKKEEKKIGKYISNLNVILFSPDDLQIIKGAPAIRRKFLNIEIGQLHYKYINILNEYNVVVKMKNEHLRSNKIDEAYLDILNDKLVKLSVDIYLYRKEFIDSINKKIKKIYKDLTGNDGLCLEYKTMPVIDKFNEKNLRKILEKEITNIRRKEINYSKTLIGPHLDDFIFFLDKEDLKTYGSQGQQRSAILSLKFSEIDIFKKIKEEYPILLLDDVLSELDEINKNNLIKHIDRDIQVVITTTNIKNIDKKLLKNSNIYIVSNGNVLKIDEVKIDE